MCLFPIISLVDILPYPTPYLSFLPLFLSFPPLLSVLFPSHRIPSLLFLLFFLIFLPFPFLYSCQVYPLNYTPPSYPSRPILPYPYPAESFPILPF